MGYAGKLDLKEQAIKLRAEGMSYSQIKLIIPVSKDTLSRWCGEIVLTDEQKTSLMHLKHLGQRKGSIIAAENKRNERISRRTEIFSSAKTEIGEISVRDTFIAGLSLYSAEGDKTDGKGGFTNADPRLILFMVKWFREFCHVPEDRLRGALWIHSDQNIEVAIVYWEKLTGIPRDKFHKTYVVEVKDNRRKKNIHPYGVFAIRFSCSDIQRRILGWISAIYGDTIPSI